VGRNTDWRYLGRRKWSLLRALNVCAMWLYFPDPVYTIHSHCTNVYCVRSTKCCGWIILHVRKDMNTCSDWHANMRNACCTLAPLIIVRNTLIRNEMGMYCTCAYKNSSPYRWRYVTWEVLSLFTTLYFMILFALVHWFSIIFRIYSLFWKSESELMISPCCLGPWCACVFININIFSSLANRHFVKLS
jgi:hypothetical protein